MNSREAYEPPRKTYTAEEMVRMYRAGKYIKLPEWEGDEKSHPYMQKDTFHECMFPAKDLLRDDWVEYVPELDG